MLPNDRRSVFPIAGAPLPPDDRVLHGIVDYERGGVDVNDPSQGVDVFDWVCAYNGTSVQAWPVGQENNPRTLFNVAGVASLTFAFDHNMRPTVAFTTQSGGLYLWWYDTVAGAHVFSPPFIDCKNPRLTLDDKRKIAQTSSDVIFAYLKKNGSTFDLCYRQQRDRYTIERTLRTGLNKNAVLKNVYMGNNWRLNFELA